MIKVTSSFIDQLVVLFWLCRLTTSQSCACLMCFSNQSIEINGQASRDSQLACSLKVLWCCRQCLITFISPTSCEAGTPNDCKTEPVMTRIQHLHCLKVLWRYISFYMFCQAVWQCCFFKKNNSMIVHLCVLRQNMWAQRACVHAESLALLLLPLFKLLQVGRLTPQRTLCKKGVANTPWAGPRGLVFDVSYLLGHGVIVNLSLFWYFQIFLAVWFEVCQASELTIFSSTQSRE